MFNELAHTLDPFRLGVLIANFDKSPACQWLGKHKQVANSVSFILVVNALRLARADRYWDLGFPNLLFGALVHANDWVQWIIGPMVDVQDVFHPTNELSIVFGSNTPLFL